MSKRFLTFHPEEKLGKGSKQPDPTRRQLQQFADGGGRIGK